MSVEPWIDGVPAQGQDAAAGPAHVAQQRLQDRGGADVLHADGVLGPADAVHERGGPLPAGVLRDQPGDLGELLRRDAADFLDELRGVPGEVPLEHLEHAARMLQRRVGVGERLGRGAAGAVRLAARRGPHSRVRPDLLVRDPVQLGIAGSPTLPRAAAGGRRWPSALGRPGSATRRSRTAAVRRPGRRTARRGPRARRKSSVRIVGRVGVGDHVVAEELVLGQHVVDQRAEEHDVGPGAHRHEQVGDRAGPGEPRVDVDDRGAALLGLHDPLEPHRVALGHVRALDQDAVSVLQVLLEGGRAAAAKRGPQTGDGGGVSNPRLVLDLDRAQGA